MGAGFGCRCRFIVAARGLGMIRGVGATRGAAIPGCVGTTLGAAWVIRGGSTLGTGCCRLVASVVMDRVMRRDASLLGMSTLGAGWSSLVMFRVGACRLRRSVVIVVASMSVVSSRNSRVESPLFKPLMALTQSAMACMILS